MILAKLGVAMAIEENAICSACHGTGETWADHKCHYCNGTGEKEDDGDS